MVSFFVESSSCMFGWSAMVVRGGVVGISASHSGVNGVFGEIPVRDGLNRLEGRRSGVGISRNIHPPSRTDTILHAATKSTAFMGLMKILTLQSGRFQISIRPFKSGTI